MNFRKKWRSVLLRTIREKGVCILDTRNAYTLAELEKMQADGLINCEVIGSGQWKCTLKMPDER